MELKLQQSNEYKEWVDAFYLPEVQPIDWLKIFHKNQLLLNDIQGFLVPQSISDTATIGLFVILKKPLKSTTALVRFPYYRFGQKLFLPFKSSLYPPATNKEIDDISLYDIQCFHNSVGFIGWEKQEAFNWEKLKFDIQTDQNTDWSLAPESPPFKIPKITSITIDAPDSGEAIVEELEKEIEKKDLKDIPLDKKSITERLKDIGKAIAIPVLKTGAVGVGLIYSLFRKIISASGFNMSDLHQNASGNHSPGVLDQLSEWFKKNLEKLEKQQQSELNKLLSMFDKNISEALKYAIPLEGDEIGRGQENESVAFKLSKTSPNFNMKGVGSGYSSYGWNLGNHYYELRQKYIAAAQQEIEKKENRKAAYIYAHLLKDYGAAANVLEQGGFYKEAATLYLEKMNNKVKAATCYEKGMLYDEAIELYKELQDYEKIGDLYHITTEEILSQKYYNTAIEKKLQKKDPINAARVAKEKLSDHSYSRKILLDGWKSNAKPEACLTNYLEESFQNDEAELPKVIEHIYKKHTPKYRQSLLLNVLHNIPKESDGVKEKSKEIAYEIISEKLLENKTTDAYKLDSFVNDKYLRSDINRFFSNKPIKFRGLNNNELQLDISIDWNGGIAHKDQLLFTGHNKTHWFIARVNKYQNVEYYTLDAKYPKEKEVFLVNNPAYTNQILLPFYNEDIKMLKNKYFSEELIISSAQGMARIDHNVTLTVDKYYRLDLEYEVLKVFGESAERLKDFIINKSDKNRSKGYKSVYNNGYIFSFWEHNFCAIDDQNGSFIESNIETGIQDFEVLSHNSILLKTYSGLTIIKFNETNFENKMPYFSSDFVGKKAFFLGSTKVIHYSEKQINIYAVEGKDAKLLESKTDLDIISCLPISRDEYAVLGLDKKVTVYSL